MNIIFLTSPGPIPSTPIAFCLGSPNLCSSDFLPQPQCYPDLSLSFLCIPLLSIYPYQIAVPASLFRHCVLPFPLVLNGFCLISSQFVHSSQYWPLWPVSATLHSWPKLLFTLSQSLWPNGKLEVHQPIKALGCLDRVLEINIASANIIFAFGQNSSIMEPHINSGRTAGCNLASSGWIFIGVAKGASLAQRLPCIKFQNMP